MKEIRKLSLKHPDMKEAAIDSVASAKILHSQILSRLQLKGDNFNLLEPATKDDMGSLWSAIHSIDETFSLQSLKKAYPTTYLSRNLWTTVSGSVTISLKFASVVLLTTTHASRLDYHWKFSRSSRHCPIPYLVWTTTIYLLRYLWVSHK